VLVFVFAVRDEVKKRRETETTMTAVEPHFYLDTSNITTSR
jgi:hypothetical protein